jgi:uncharacterized membrane protein HdeD (DUF308 family)
VISFFLIFSGTYEVITAISLRREIEVWWIQLIGGLIQLGLGFWAAGYYGRSAVLLVAWVAYCSRPFGGSAGEMRPHSFAEI